MIKLAVHALLLAIPLLITGLAVGAQMDEPQLRRSGFLGVQVGPVTDDRASSGDLQVKSGVLVVGLVEGGSAGAAGFRRGDIIIAMNETRWMVRPSSRGPSAVFVRAMKCRYGTSVMELQE